MTLINMALSESVESSLKEAESNLRNALAYAARQERPVVCAVIAELITKLIIFSQWILSLISWRIVNLEIVVVLGYLQMMNEL